MQWNVQRLLICVTLPFLQLSVRIFKNMNHTFRRIRNTTECIRNKSFRGSKRFALPDLLCSCLNCVGESGITVPTCLRNFPSFFYNNHVKVYMTAISCPLLLYLILEICIFNLKDILGTGVFSSSFCSTVNKAVANKPGNEIYTIKQLLQKNISL